MVIFSTGKYFVTSHNGKGQTQGEPGREGVLILSGIVKTEELVWGNLLGHPKMERGKHKGAEGVFILSGIVKTEESSINL